MCGKIDLTAPVVMLALSAKLSELNRNPRGFKVWELFHVWSLCWVSLMENNCVLKRCNRIVLATLALPPKANRLGGS